MIQQGDWARLWRDLASRDLMTGDDGEKMMVDRWRKLARRLDENPDGEPDALLEFALGRLGPGDTVLDIGAGVGRWTVPIARRVARVTAIEPVPAMREILQGRLAANGLSNVTIVPVPWDDAAVEQHTAAVAVHSMYTSADLLAFVRKIETAAQWCYVAMRVPAADGAIGELAARIRGCWHDSPNFVVGYNTLLEAGCYPSVLMEDAPSRVWADPSLEEAVGRAKRHLRIDDAAHDATIREVLTRRLVPVGDDGFVWPDGMRAALCWWRAGSHDTRGGAR